MTMLSDAEMLPLSCANYTPFQVAIDYRSQGDAFTVPLHEDTDRADRTWVCPG